MPRRATERPTRKSEALARLSSRVMALAKRYQLDSRNRVCRHGITVTQCYALELLVDRGEALVTELAAALALDKSNASRVADSLVDLGLARVVPVPDNARLRRLVPTRKGTSLARKIAAEIEAEHRHAFGAFDAASIDACERVLASLLAGGKPTR